MLVHDVRILALLPAVGLCSCVASSETLSTAALHDPGESGEPAGLIEREPEREPLTIEEAMIRSGRESLAVGHYEAAFASLSLARQQFPERDAELALDVIDAALGARKLSVARALIEGLPTLTYHSDAQLKQTRLLQLHELENGAGLGACEAHVDPEPRSLRRVADELAAWNELRSGLPADHAIPIPSSAEALSEVVCPIGCATGEPNFARLDGDNESTIALVIAHEDGSLSVMPDLLHTVDTGCGDQTTLGFEQHEGLLRVRAFGDRLYNVDPDDWQLLDVPEYGAPTITVTNAPSPSPSPSYAYGSSGYQASSGYRSYGYGSGYGYNYGCGYGHGGYDDYDGSTCEIEAHVERDVIVDLDRGEVVLDIVRTGNRGSALGRVTMASAPEGSIVDVDACGVSRSLPLSYT